MADEGGAGGESGGGEGGSAGAVAIGEVAVGAVAPDFELRDQHGTPTRLSSVLAGGPVVLVFFPWAFTSVCTGELRRLREEMPTFAEAGARVIAVSCDPMTALRVFADNEQLEFPVLSDFWPHGAVARAYGVFDESIGAALRGTFVIDAGGTVRWSVVNGLPDARDTDEYRAALADL